MIDALKHKSSLTTSEVLDQLVSKLILHATPTLRTALRAAGFTGMGYVWFDESARISTAAWERYPNYSATTIWPNFLRRYTVSERRLRSLEKAELLGYFLTASTRSALLLGTSLSPSREMETLVTATGNQIALTFASPLCEHLTSGLSPVSTMLDEWPESVEWRFI